MFSLDEFWADPNRVYRLRSKIPPSTLNEDVILGIDEAGRGPVLGPMIYSAAYCPFSIQKIIDKEKFQDSKTLTETQRRSMFTEIDNFEDIGWLSTILPPTLISTSMLKRCKYNLNQLSQDTAINLIQDLLDDGVRIQEVYVDTVGVPEKYEALLRRKFPSIKKIKVSKKADSLFKIVSIASICAKVLRDFIVENWKFIEKIDFDHLDYGSGYPSDPKTKEYLTKIFDPIFGYPQFVRFSWSTITKILEEKAVPCRWDDDDDDDDANPNNSNEKNKVKNHKISKQKSIDTFFAPKNHHSEEKKIRLKSSSFFINRKIDQIQNIEEIFSSD